ncbi:hypothetical protein O181_048012 [Austropuccinia psidii MF-1]|uniref:HAT C-terminal dimerisation domain-containing protein n=1 Tax=Austropuccinia psidii MF-1 TaxID=1389203 RepID=A0A9Q3DUA1_9BASI|nr:hypothetical protein [Austropuccinia psidii MF-1]
MSKVCLSVFKHEQGFCICPAHQDDEKSDTPAICKNIKQLIEDRDHFTSNKVLVTLIRAVVDAIAHLECENTTIGDIWKELIISHKKIKEWIGYSRFQDLKNHCIEIIHKQSAKFLDKIYIVGFFLSPLYCQVAVSCKHSLDDVARILLEIAKEWKFSRNEALTIIDQIQHYYSNEAPFNLLKTSSAQNYWLQLPSNKDTAALKRISIALLEVVPHAAGVESLFSIMSAVKTKGQNCMAPNTLHMVSQHIQEKNTFRADFMDCFDSFLLPDELENFDKGVFENGSKVQSICNEAFMDTLFDFEMFDSSTMDSEEVIRQGLDTVEEKWEIHHLL